MDLLKNLFKGDKVIWIIFLLLCLVSIIEVFSASSTLTYKSGDHWRPITMHMILMAVGAIVVLIVHNIPCRWFKTFIILLPISWLLLIAVFIIGALTNGAKRWIDLGFIQFQPSEVAKMATIITVAFILSKMQEEKQANPKAFKYILWVTHTYHYRESFHSRIVMWKRISHDVCRTSSSPANGYACRHMRWSSNLCFMHN